MLMDRDGFLVYYIAQSLAIGLSELKTNLLQLDFMVPVLLYPHSQPIIFVCFFGLMLNFPVNSYGHIGRSVHLTTLFSWASLTKQLTSTLCKYFHW